VLLEHGLAARLSDPARHRQRELALVGTKAASSGIVISTYRPSGALRAGFFDDEAG
jgi:hypothetical protein